MNIDLHTHQKLYKKENCSIESVYHPLDKIQLSYFVKKDQDIVMHDQGSKKSSFANNLDRKYSTNSHMSTGTSDHFRSAERVFENPTNSYSKTMLERWW